MKSGIYTTELYVTLASMLLSPLVADGFITRTNADVLTSAIVTILGIIVPAVVYTVSRSWLKAKTVQAATPTV